MGSLVLVHLSLQQVNAYFQGREGLAGAVVQVTSHPTPFFILHSQKPLGKDLKLRCALQNQQFECEQDCLSVCLV